LVCREKPVSSTKAIGSSFVLLARIVNGAGRPVRPPEIAMLEYSVNEGALRRLDVAGILSSRLRRDELRGVGDDGYNFRHDLKVSSTAADPLSGGRVELCYVFTHADKTRSTVRFHLKVV
jgi:hypothetical protein